MSITGRTKTGDIKLPEPPEPARAGELTDDRLVAGRLENIARELRELLLVLRDQIVPALREQHELIMLLEQDRNELFQRVTQLEAKAG